MNNNQKILVTGGLGFIGSHTTVELINAGYEVVIVDDLSNSQAFILDRIEQITNVRPMFYQIDMCDKEKLLQCFQLQKNIAAVIHFAASKSVGESVRNPLKYFHNNLLSLIKLLECMQEFAVNKMVFSSSATVYGQPDQLPAIESTPFQKALSAYGSTKQMGEEILEKTSAAKNMNVIALRYFNPVGAHQSALIGELPFGIPNNLMPFVTQVAAGKLKRLTILGDDYNTVDGTCVRDYVHVVDLAKAHVKSCGLLLKARQQAKYEVFNIGTGYGISVLEIIRAFEKYNAIKLNYIIGKRREGDAECIYADVTKANAKLGWKAKMGLKEIVTHAWQWQKALS